MTETDGLVLVTAQPGLGPAALAARSEPFIDLPGMTRGLQVENLVRLSIKAPLKSVALKH